MQTDSSHSGRPTLGSDVAGALAALGVDANQVLAEVEEALGADPTVLQVAIETVRAVLGRRGETGNIDGYPGSLDCVAVERIAYRCGWALEQCDAYPMSGSLLADLIDVLVRGGAISRAVLAPTYGFTFGPKPLKYEGYCRVQDNVLVRHALEGFVGVVEDTTRMGPTKYGDDVELVRIRVDPNTVKLAPATYLVQVTEESILNPDHDAEEASIERLAAGDIEDFELLSNEIWRELCQLRGLNEGVVGRDVWETLCRRRKWLHGRFGYLRH